MIQIQTNLLTNDNTGIKLAQCLKIYKKKTGKIGDKILISVKKLKFNKKKKIKICNGDLFKAYIVHTTFHKKNTIGNFIKFDNNAIIILNNQNNPLGSRIFGPITSYFRNEKFLKILSLSSNII